MTYNVLTFLLTNHRRNKAQIDRKIRGALMGLFQFACDAKAWREDARSADLFGRVFNRDRGGKMLRQSRDQAMGNEC